MYLCFKITNPGCANSRGKSKNPFKINRMQTYKKITTPSGKEYAIIAADLEPKGGDFVVSYVPAHTAKDDSWADEELVDVYIDRKWLAETRTYEEMTSVAIEEANAYMQGERRVA